MLRREVPVPKGGPARPLSAAEVEAKALALAEPTLGPRAPRLVALAQRLDELESVDELSEMRYASPLVSGGGENPAP